MVKSFDKYRDFFNLHILNTILFFHDYEIQAYTEYKGT